MSYSIYPIHSSSSNLPVCVIGIGYEDNQPHVLRKEGFIFPQIFICISGEGILKTNEAEYSIKEGSFFVLPANVPHEYYGTADKWEVEWIAFSGCQTESILKELRMDRTYVAVCNNAEKTAGLFQKIINALKYDNIVSTAISSGILYEILTQLFCEICQYENHEVLDEDSKINQIKLYIDEHFEKDISLDELSELADITPQYLCRLFKRYLNLRPFQYITMKRIQQAKKLLSDNSLSINEIAHMTGFNDCSYFCAIFKKIVMMSPTDFRGTLLHK